MKPANAKLDKRPFEVKIPNLEGDGIAETVHIQVEVWKDEETGEEVLTPESLELIDRTKARRMGLISPSEIRKLRERLNLTQSEISELLQIGEKSYTRWENGKARPSRSMNVLLCALRDARLDVNYLRSLRNPGFDWFRVIQRYRSGANQVCGLNRTGEQRVEQQEQEHFVYWQDLTEEALTNQGELLIHANVQRYLLACSASGVFKAYPKAIAGAKYVLSEAKNPGDDDPNLIMEWNTTIS